MTQPARKKETATQLELLEAELTAARKVTARYRTAMENAEKRHGAAEDAQAVAQYRYDCALVASWGDTPDWMTLLDGDEDRSSVMYELAREGLERLGLGTSMINMETGHRLHNVIYYPKTVNCNGLNPGSLASEAVFCLLLSQNINGQCLADHLIDGGTQCDC